MKLFKLSFLILSLFCLLGIYFFQISPPKNESKFLVRVPVSFFPFYDRPTMKVEIEGKAYSLLIDLGSSRSFDLRTRYLKKLKNKQVSRCASYISLDGTLRNTPGYKVSNIEIRSLTVHEALVFEEGNDFLKNKNVFPSFILWDRWIDTLHSLFIQGSVGWGLFKELNCIFDFPKSEIIIAKNADHLFDKTSYSIKEFVRIPFHLEQYGVVVDFETSQGQKKLLLDTGATCSILRSSTSQFTNKEQHLVSTDKLISGGHDFGKWSFDIYDFSEWISCDGILGIDFFKKHTIYFDFQNQTAYLKAT